MNSSSASSSNLPLSASAIAEGRFKAVLLSTFKNSPAELDVLDAEYAAGFPGRW